MNNSVALSPIARRTCQFLTTLSLAAMGAVSYAEPAVDALKERMMGAYELMEWHAADGQVFRPPTVEGRFVVLDGSITAIFTNRIKSPTATTLVAFGKYTLDSQKFAYAYDSTSLVTEAPSETTISHKPLWEGMRVFAVSSEDGRVRLRTEGGKQEFVFSAGSVTYSEGGVTRLWRRITE